MIQDDTTASWQGEDAVTRVAFLATGTDQNCGIATYTAEIRRALDVPSELIPLRLGALAPLHYLRAGWKAARTDADVLHVQHEYGIYGPKSVMSWLLFGVLWLATRFRDLPVVVTFHSAWNSGTIDPPLYTLKRLYVALNNHLLAATLDHAIFLSDGTRDAFIESVPLDDCTVVSHGVQTETHPMPATEAKAEFGYDADKTLVVEPGYVRPQKGYERFIEIAEAMPDTAFLIGGGPKDESDEAYADEIRRKSPDNVRMTGVLDEDRFHALFNAMDVAVLPYDVVTQSGIVNWCVAYEVPMVATDLERFRTLEDEYGFPRVFPADDATTGADAIRDVLADPEPIVEAMTTYRNEHGMDAVADTHEKIYRQLAGTPRVKS